MLTIYRIGDDAPVRLAASELRKYLGRMTGEKITVRSRREHDASAPGIWVGRFTAFAAVPEALVKSDFDDRIHIDVGRKGGIVAGVNPRSVLLAAYRYLTELGCRWVRPGRDGEVVPSLRNPLARAVSVREAPAHRHRCVCIEGAVSWEHVRDLIEWMPKLGFNSYFIQFRTAFQFFVRWYHHEHNPRMKPQRFTQADARRLTAKIMEACAQRGMILQTMGHGWNCEPFGIPGLGWMEHKKPPPAKMKPLLAMIDGKRDWWNKMPLSTQLCYGNPKTRKIVVDGVVQYAQEHPNVPIILFVLADGCNNHCECPRCTPHLPSDLYVRMCNDIDAELTRRNLSAKIAFDLYVDCLWPPKTQRLKNPDRFIVLFAPITRTYTHSLKSALDSKRRLPPFKRNRLAFPADLAENLAFLRPWQRIFKGDSFHFDYHLMWDHFKDPGHVDLARVMHEDIRQLHRIGLDGLNSCQVHRCFVPTSLIMTVMGRTLWNPKLSFDAMANDLYRSTFGADWRKALRFTQSLSDLFDPPFFRSERSDAQKPQTLRKLAKIPARIERFEPVIEAHEADKNHTHATSWKYLRLHCELSLELAAVLEIEARGDHEGARQAAEGLFETARRQERRNHRVFDTCLFLKTVALRLGISEKDLQ